MTERDNLLRFFLRAAEAVEHAAHFAPIFAHDLEGVAPGIALMDDDVEPEFDREVELLLKQTRLLALERAVVDFALDSVVSFGLQSA